MLTIVAEMLVELLITVVAVHRCIQALARCSYSMKGHFDEAVFPIAYIYVPYVFKF